MEVKQTTLEWLNSKSKITFHITTACMKRCQQRT
jgi:hypothetical protein